MTVVSRPWRTFRWLAVIFALLAVLMAPASAGADGHVPPAPDDVNVLGTRGNYIRFEGPHGKFYPHEDYFVMTGGPIEDACFGPPPMTEGVTKQNADGTWTSKLPTPQRISVYVYDMPAGGFPVPFGVVCPAIAEGAAPPEPIAVGSGLLNARETKADPYWSYLTDGQPDGHYVNSLRGYARTTHGRYLLISALADYVSTAGELDFNRFYTTVKALDD